MKDVQNIINFLEIKILVAGDISLILKHFDFIFSTITNYTYHWPEHGALHQK